MVAWRLIVHKTSTALFEWRNILHCKQHMHTHRRSLLYASHNIAHCIIICAYVRVWEHSRAKVRLFYMLIYYIDARCNHFWLLLEVAPNAHPCTLTLWDKCVYLGTINSATTGMQEVYYATRCTHIMYGEKFMYYLDIQGSFDKLLASLDHTQIMLTWNILWTIFVD